MRIVFLLIAALISPAVAAYGRQSPALRANADGNQAYFRGDFETALKNFEQSRSFAADSNDSQYEAIAMYNLGRTNVQLCHLSEADRWFKAAIKARESLPDEKYARLTQNLVQYSRFLFSTGRPAEAVPLVEKAIPLLVGIGLEQSDPIAFAELLEQEAEAQKTLGLSSETAESHALALRLANPSRVAKYKPEPFPVKCEHSP